MPLGAVNDWAGHDGEVAQYAGGGWVFFTPRRGWRAFVEERAAATCMTAAAGADGGLSVTPGGAGCAPKASRPTW